MCHALPSVIWLLGRSAAPHPISCLGMHLSAPPHPSRALLPPPLLPLGLFTCSLGTEVPPPSTCMSHTEPSHGHVLCKASCAQPHRAGFPSLLPAPPRLTSTIGLPLLHCNGTFPPCLLPSLMRLIQLPVHSSMSARVRAGTTASSGHRCVSCLTSSSSLNVVPGSRHNRPGNPREMHILGSHARPGNARDGAQHLCSNKLSSLGTTAPI